MRGPAPKSKEVKQREGNPGKRPINLQQPDGVRGVPTPPDWVLGEVRRRYFEMAEVLDRLGVLRESDYLMLSVLADLYVSYLSLKNRIRRYGSVYSSKNEQGEKTYRARPETQLLGATYQRLIQLAARFGMTPSDRSRVSAGPGGGKVNDPFKDWEKRRGDSNSA